MMDNVMYKAGVTPEQVKRSNFGNTLLELVQMVAPVRPKLKFVLMDSSTCYVYAGSADLTGGDTHSPAYVGCIHSCHGSYRGGKGYRAGIVLKTAGGGVVANTVSLTKAATEFKKAFVPRPYIDVIRTTNEIAERVINRMRADYRRNMHAEMLRLVERMPDTELAEYYQDIIDGVRTPMAWKEAGPSDYATQLRDLCAVFGDAGNSRLACVMQVGGVYIMRHGKDVTEHSVDTLPAHISRAIGMLKLAGIQNELMVGYGIPLPGNAYAVSIEEVEV